MKCVPVHHGIPAVLHRYEPWLHRHSENGALHGGCLVVSINTYRKQTKVLFTLNELGYYRSKQTVKARASLRKCADCIHKDV